MKDFLVRLRTSRDLSQADAARLAGVTRSAANAWEGGTSTPDPVVLVRLLDAVGATPEERAEARALMEAHLGLDAIDRSAASV